MRRARWNRENWRNWLAQAILPGGGNMYFDDGRYFRPLCPLDNSADVDRYLLAMERLSIISAKPSETPGILTTIINQLED